MNLYPFLVGPLLWITFIVFFIGLLVRSTFFFYSIIQSSKGKDQRWKYVFASIARLIFPFHKAITERPFYAPILYLFHASFIIVPIWVGGHIVLLSTSRLGWSWTPLPDSLADMITIFALILVAFYFIRRIILADVIVLPSKSNFFLLALTGVPFLSGFFAYHQWFDYKLMLNIHILSGELMLIVAACFLYCRLKLDIKTCVGCAACAQNCLTGAIDSHDSGGLRLFRYSPFQCICCGMCVKVCPETAAKLRHAISFKTLFQGVPKREIRSVELSICEKCGCSFAPLPQLEKLGQLAAEEKIEIARWKYCDACRRRETLEQMHVRARVHLKKAI